MEIPSPSISKDLKAPSLWSSGRVSKSQTWSQLKIKRLIKFICYVIVFRPSLIKVNQTHVLPVSESPPVLLYNKTSVLGEDYASRLRVTEKQVILTSVRMTDEGSFTVIDREGQIKMKNCLNVKGVFESAASSKLWCLHHVERSALYNASIYV